MSSQSVSEYCFMPEANASASLQLYMTLNKHYFILFYLVAQKTCVDVNDVVCG